MKTAEENMIMWKELTKKNPMHDARLDLLNAVADIASGNGRTQICAGLKGMGKSTIVKRELRRLGLPVLSIDHTTPLTLCEQLEFCAQRKVVGLIDDADGIFYDDKLLMILQKAVYNNGDDPRIYSWRGVNYNFDGFCGMILTNKNMKDTKSFGQRIRIRIESFVSRCRTSIILLTREEVYLWTVYMAVCEQLLGNLGATLAEANDALQFYATNASCMEDLSVRCLVEIWKLRHDRPETWERTARSCYVDQAPSPLNVPREIPRIIPLRTLLLAA